MTTPTVTLGRFLPLGQLLTFLLGLIHLTHVPRLDQRMYHRKSLLGISNEANGFG